MGFLAYIIPVGGAEGGGGHPAHPIAPGGPGGIVSPPIYYPPEIWPTPPGGGGGSPPGIWGGGNVPMPTPPIHLGPGGGIGGPPGIWGGGNVPMPTPPIFLPPEQLPPDIQLPEGKGLLVLFVPGQGHVAFVVDVPPGRPTQPIDRPEPK